MFSSSSLRPRSSVCLKRVSSSFSVSVISGCARAELGIGLAHHLDQRRHQPVHQRIATAHDMGVAHRAAHDPAQHIAAALVGRQHAVGDQERRGAQMIGDDAMRNRMPAIGRHVRRLRRRHDQPAHQVDVVIVVLALQHRRDALQPHARVDRRLGQRHAIVGRQLLELHEHEIPDLDEAVAVLLGAARRPAREMRPVIVENLRARPAWPRVAHRPEIIGRADADDLLVRQARRSSSNRSPRPRPRHRR